MSNKKNNVVTCQDSASGLYSASKKNVAQTVKPTNNSSEKNKKN